MCVCVCVRERECVSVRECVCVPPSPVQSFVVVVGVEELHFLVRLGAGEVTGDGGMHQEEQIKSGRA